MQGVRAIYTVRQITVQAFEDQALLMELLQANLPFVVRGLSFDASLYQQTLELFQRSKINLFNVLGDNSESGEIRNYHELLEAVLQLKTSLAKHQNLRLFWQEHAALFSKYLIASDQLKTHANFNVQFDVIPETEIHQRVVLPASAAYAHVLERFTQRSYLNTVLSISHSQGNPFKKTKNIHAHNYDTFGIFIKAGSQSEVYFFPPAYYAHFNTRLVAAAAGVLLLIPDDRQLDDKFLEEALVFKGVEPGDVIYTPPLWFHCFHHSGEYLNIANGEFFPELLKERLAQIRPRDFGPDWQQVVWHTQQLQRLAGN